MKIGEDKNCELIIYIMMKRIYVSSDWWNRLFFPSVNFTSNIFHQAKDKKKKGRRTLIFINIDYEIN